MSCAALLIVFLITSFPAALATPPTDPKPAPAGSEREALQEAIRFERHKLATAQAQRRKEGRGKAAEPTAAAERRARAQSESEALQEAIKFERHKVAAAGEQDRKEAAAAARVKAGR